MKFSKRTDWPAASNPLAAQVEILKKNKIPFFDLTVSNPTLCQLNYLDPGILSAFRNPQNLVYEPDPHGLSNAREAVARYYSNQGIQMDPGRIILTANTSEAYSFIFRLLFEPEACLLAPQPSYPLLDDLASLHDIQVKRYPLVYSGQWRIDLKKLEKLTAPAQRAILLVNPNNPTGNFISDQEKKFIRNLCRSRSLALICDEVFLDFSLEAKSIPMSLSAASDVLTFTLSGISKILGLPQMKLSWIIVSGPEKIRREALRRLEIISDTYLSASTPIQNALPVWLYRQEEITKEILERIKANYETLVKKSSALSEIELFAAEGGWNAVLRLPGHKSDEEWALLFLQEDRVLIHPGYLFDFTQEHCIVLSLLVPPGIFKEGVDRIFNRILKAS